MGAGIAQVAAATAHKVCVCAQPFTTQQQVVLVDTSEAVLGKALDRIAGSVAKIAKKQHKDDEAAAAKAKEATMVMLATHTSPKT